jgi:hypothetical protein
MAGYAFLAWFAWMMLGRDCALCSAYEKKKKIPKTSVNP